MIKRLYKRLFCTHAAKRYSESNEGPLLRTLIDKIPIKHRTFLDIGAGSGFYGSNTIDLLLNKRFKGVFIEGDANNLHKLHSELEKVTSIHKNQYLLHEGYVSSDNINSIVQSFDGFNGFDIISIDIDSVDFWVWKAFDIMHPAIVIVEFQCIFKEEESLVSPNMARQGFVQRNGNTYCISNSASLSAFVKLGHEKGYTLVAVSDSGFNAFFVKNDFALKNGWGITVEQGLDRDFTRWAQQEFGKDIHQFDWLPY